MVQLRTESPSRPNDYWKLDMTLIYLTSRPTSTSAQASTARDFLSRRLRGLFDYERCTVTELRRFALRRKLSKTGDGNLESQHPEQGASARKQFRRAKQEKASLVALLEKADDDHTFDRFLDLPPELRACVYDFYFAWLLAINEDSLSCVTSPTPPPITETCSILRRETLKPFYQTCYLDLRFEESSGNYRMAEKESKILLNAPPSHVAMVRKIKLRCEFRAGRCWFLVAVEIDIGTGALPDKRTLLNPVFFDLTEAKTVGKLGGQVDEWIGEIRGRSEVVKLQASDVCNLFRRAKATYKWSARGQRD